MTDLGPRNISSPFALPAEDWTAINQRVFLVQQGYHGGEYAKYSKVSIYSDLVSTCREWQQSTFPALVALAKRVARYGEETAPAKYPLLCTAVDPSLLDEATAMAEEARALRASVKTFRDVNDKADVEYRQNGYDWTSLAPRPEKVAEATALVQGDAAALADDLESIRRDLQTLGGQKDSYLRELGVDAALAAWRNAAREASDFVGGAGAQDRYLTGEYLYDVPKVRADRRYRLTSNISDGGDASHVLAARKPKGPSEVALAVCLLGWGDDWGPYYTEWTFERLGAGWYRIRAAGTDWVLDTNLVVRATQIVPEGQYWKVQLSADVVDPGIQWPRFVNNFQPGMALTGVRHGDAVEMRALVDGPSQFWEFYPGVGGLDYRNPDPDPR
jgi:hypothetical protein